MSERRRREPEELALLSAEERRAIAWRVAPLLAGGALLALGGLLALLRPAEPMIAELARALAAALVGAPFIVRGARDLFRREARDPSAQLVALAVLAAMAAGSFVTATLVPLFMELGRLFEERSARGARAAIEGIRRLGARRAHRLAEAGSPAEREEAVDPEQLVPGELVLVRPGETIPADGRVRAGHSSIDQAPITGESLFEDVGPGSSVYAGTVNLGGLLRVEVLRSGEASVLGRVVRLLAEVEGARTPLLRLVDRLAGVYLPLVLTLAAAVLFVSGSLERAIAVLVVACPSALFLAGPAAMVAALSAATRRRMLLKSAVFLEALPEVQSLVLDKTGTVTEGALSIERIEPLGGASEEALLAAAASAGWGSLHPVSRALVGEARRRGVAFARPEEIEEKAGSGVRATIDGRRVLLGRAGWLASEGFACRDEARAGESVVWVAEGERVLGRVALSDGTRPEARAALEDARLLGIERVLLVTGDRRAVAEAVGAKLGVDEVHAEVLPEQKLALVRAEQQAGRKVLMLGDGVNDALALSGADVGVAVGRRVDEIALGGADVALVGGDLTRLPLLVDLSRMTRRIVLGNVALVAGYGALLVLLASLGVVGPLLGAWLHNIDALLVVANSARLVRLYAPRGEEPEGESPEGARAGAEPGEREAA